MSAPRPPTPFAEGLGRSVAHQLAQIMILLEEFEVDDGKRWRLLRDECEQYAGRPRKQN